MRMSRLKAAGAELRKPHRGIVFDPGNRPALAATQLAEGFVDRVPSQRVAQGGEDDVFGQR